MKYKTLLLLLSLLLLAVAPASQAQFMGDSYGAATYNMGLPLSDTKDFTNTYSWRGMGLEFRKFTKPNMSVGLSLGWNVFHEEVNGTVDFSNGRGAATGNQDRTINAFPLMVGLQVYGGHEGSARPFIGVYGPGYYIEQRLDMGIYSFQDDGWNWGLAPEIGFLVPLQSGANMLLSARYNYAFEASGRGPFNYLGFNVGFAWSNY